MNDAIGKIDAAPAMNGQSLSWGRGFGVDLSIAFVVGVLAFGLAKSYLPVYRSSGVAPAFYYQDQFGPAVMMACGRGFSNPDLSTSPELRAFLQQRIDHFRCDELTPAVRIQPLNAFQEFSRYLMIAAAADWWAAGIRWRAIDLLTATFFAVSIAAAYVALRFICGRVLSLFTTVLWATSTWHLRNLPHLRDYSKVPFFVLTLVAIAVLCVERRPGRLLLIGGVFGAVQGLGYGMRADVGLNFIPFLIVLFAYRSSRFSVAFSRRLACAVVAIMAFVLIAYPIMSTYQHSGVLWHVMILGLTSPYDVNLHLPLPLPPYNFGYLYRDAYVETVVGSYWARLHPAANPIVLGMRTYGEACRTYYQTVAGTFPGDILTRMTAAAVHVFNIPFSLVYGHVPLGITSPTLSWLYDVRGAVVEMFENSGPLLLAAVLVLVGMEGLRYACIAFVLLLAVAGYPSLQYQYRHVFQLELVVLAMIACGGSLVWKRLCAIPRDSARETLRRAVMACALVAALVAAVIGVLGAARAVQGQRASRLLNAYSTATKDALALQLLPLADGKVRVAADLFGPPADDGVQTAMLVAEFVSGGHGASSIPATFRYQDRDPEQWLGFSWEAVVPLARDSSDPTRVFLPVYSVHRESLNVTRFAGVEVSADRASCVHLFRVRDLGELPSLLLPAMLGPTWGAERLYQRVPMDRVVPASLWRRVTAWWPGMSQFG